MARKSGWQEFAENFKSSYKMVNDVKQQYATNRIMDDKIVKTDAGKYTYKDNEYGTENEALSQQYSRLADNSTRFGDTKGGLGYRKQIADIEQSRIANDIARANKESTIEQNGLLRSAIMRSQANVNNAGASLSYAKASEIKKLLGPKFDRAKALARNAGYDADVAGINAYLAENTKTKTLASQIAELETNISKQEAEIQIIDDGSYVEAGIAANEQKTAEANVAIEVAEDDSAAGALIQSAKADQQEAIVREGNAINTEALLEMDFDKRIEVLSGEIEKAKADNSTATLEALSAAAFLTFAEDYQKGEFGTGKEASEAYITIVGAFDPEKAGEMQAKYNTREIEAIATQGLRIQSEVSRLVQDQDLEGIRAYFDANNGDEGVVLKVDPSTGAIDMYETAPGSTDRLRTLAQADNTADGLAAISQMTTYGNAAAYAESLFARKKGLADVLDVESQTELRDGAQTKNIESETEYRDGAQTDVAESLIDLRTAQEDDLKVDTAYQKIINSTAKYTEILKQNDIQAKTKLANQQVIALRQEHRINRGKKWDEALALKAFNSMVSDPNYAYVTEQLSDTPGAIDLHENRVKMSLGLLRRPPSGFSGSMEQWLSLDEAGRAAFP